MEFYAILILFWLRLRLFRLEIGTILLDFSFRFQSLVIGIGLDRSPCFRSPPRARSLGSLKIPMSEDNEEITFHNNKVCTNQ